jgi:hypothetical protein
MVTTEGSDGDAHEIGSVPGCSCAREGWRDVAGAYLVHAGLSLASRDGRNRMLHVLSEEWRAAVRRQLERSAAAAARAEAMARHPAGKGRAPVHLADRMDAAYRASHRRPR